ncbi:putative Vacuolar protein sorting-associated protein 36 [Blattamonas nauphoetae]|uniref:Vacuolar protein-sorting-associated protein 36 n=1 Tax=Blattamonas nauphoetae TaxID=2049346 RepID=A0ABQ9YKV5_9EUKA|nr:putative Vacuolar protein sorting-associated protein 36 [Blattamonas nauphoetae]
MFGLSVPRFDPKTQALELEENERRVFTVDSVYISEDKKSYDKANNFKVILTSSRVVFVREDELNRSLSLYIDMIIDYLFKQKAFSKSYIQVTHTLVSGSNATLFIHQKSKGLNELSEKLKEEKLRRAKALAASQASTTIPDEPTKFEFKGGKSLSAQQAEDHLKSVVAGSFDDIDSLMQGARELLGLAQDYTRVLSRNLDTSQISQSEKEDYLVFANELGIDSAVTRESAGTDYEKELSREFATLMFPILERSGGTMTLVDAYATYNRARGINLISPDDLIKCTKLFPSLNISLRVSSLKSGVSVVHLLSHGEEQMKEKTLAYLRTKKETGFGYSILDVAAHLNISSVLAKQYLLSCEENNLICRDEVSDTTLFYPNFFLNKADLALLTS